MDLTALKDTPPWDWPKETVRQSGLTSLCGWQRLMPSPASVRMKPLKSFDELADSDDVLEAVDEALAMAEGSFDIGDGDDEVIH